jgi:hypothetical protein
MKEILKYISAKHFFADYCTEVKNFTHKMRGKDGNGNPIEFSPDDKKLIAACLKKMVANAVTNLKNVSSHSRKPFVK